MRADNPTYRTRPMFGHEQEIPGSDDWYTPAWIFEGLDVRFDLDVAAPPDGIPWIPADRYYTKADDGLSAEWSGLVWCNPPYSESALWARKWATHPDGIILVPMSKSNWLAEVMAACGLVVVPARFNFASYSARDGYPGGSISLAVWFGARGTGVPPLERLLAANPGWCGLVAVGVKGNNE